MISVVELLLIALGLALLAPSVVLFVECIAARSSPSEPLVNTRR
jgi:hypothetical protein